jgi:hypothetical protein
MARALERSILAVFLAGFGLALGLSACSPGPMIDRLPSDMGLPAGTPARPTTPYQYPAVHDMPPPRSDQPMSDDEQLKMQRDLQAVRDRQERQQEGKGGKTAGPGAKKKPATAKNGQADGAKTGAKTNP